MRRVSGQQLARSPVVRILGVTLVTAATFLPVDRKIPRLGAIQDLGFLTLGIAILLVAIRVEWQRTHERSPVYILLVVGYLSARILSGGLESILSVRHWSPIDLTELGPRSWVIHTYVVGLLIFIQYWLLNPLWPRIITNLSRPRNWCAIALLLGVAVGGGALRENVGAASSSLITAIVVVLVICLATNRTYIALAAAACAAFLADSVLGHEPGPSDILSFGHYGAADVDFRISPADGELIDLSRLRLFVNIWPDPPTLLGCPDKAHMLIFATIPNASDEDRETESALLRSSYMIAVTGSTTIVNSRENAVGTSKVVREESLLADVHTEYFGDRLHIGAPSGDSFSAEVPLQSRRAMGSCYVSIPQLNQGSFESSHEYLYGPSVGGVTLDPAPGTTIDLDETRPAPTPDSSNPDEMDWSCFDYESGHVTDQCPAVAVVVADWAAPYREIMLVFVGALVAIGAERVFSTLSHRDDPAKKVDQA